MSFEETYRNIENDFYQTKLDFADTFLFALEMVSEEEDPEFHVSIRKAIQLLDITAPAKRGIHAMTKFGNNLERDLNRKMLGHTANVRNKYEGLLFDEEHPITDLGQVQEIFLDAANRIKQLQEKLEREDVQAAA